MSHPEKRAVRVWLLRAVKAAVLLAVLGGAVFGYRRCRQSGQAAPRLRTARVERGDIVARVTAGGTLSAVVTVQVGSQVSGRIKDIFVDFNSEVKKGQLIAKIDPQLFQAAIEQDRASYLAARGELTRARVQAQDAELQLQRTRYLRREKIASQSDLDTAQTTASAARAQVEIAHGRLAQALAALHQAEVNLAYTNIVSPINGVVISRNVDVGQTVAASFQAPVLFVLAEDLRKMQVDTSVAEADIGKLRPGMTATFTVDAYPAATFTGAVRQIRNAAQTVQNVVTYNAVIDVENRDLLLRPGMTANVSFVYAQKRQVLRVPNAALRFRPPPGLVRGSPAGNRYRKPRAAGSGRPVLHAEARPSPTPETRAGASPPEASPPPGRTAETRDQRPEQGPAPQLPGQPPRTVWVADGRAVRPVVVRIGISDGTWSELVAGPLHAGDAVVTDVITRGGGGRPAGGRPGRRIF